ncbi:nucleoside/nucleotide kinase family protein [Streptomyces anthocyanicus]|uniref:thymidylate kinase n=1 Tax=Streptomyces anthocyanicus TaxID=68174 RepID=UPI0037FDAE06
MGERYPLIVLEGGDGAGKTTLRKGLFRLIESLYGVTPLSILTTNFLAPDAAGALVEGKHQPSAENRDRYLSALCTDKRATVERLILPALPCRPVIADRWIISELAFFAVKHATPPERTYAALAPAVQIRADATLLLETTAEAAVARAAHRADDAARPDWDNVPVQERVRAVHREITARPEAFGLLGPLVRIDASADRPTVLAAAWDALRERRLLPALPLTDTSR